VLDRSTTSRRPTMKEVARLADVSHSTVSRYLHADPRINEAARERIAAAIAELNYRPNLVARAMRDRKTGRLALLLPGAPNGNYAMITGAAAAAHGAGYVVEVITVGGPSHSTPARALELADSNLFEGIVSLTPLDGSPSHSDGTPIVSLPSYDDRTHTIGALADAGPVAEFITRLAEDGHRRFLHLAGDHTYTSARRREQVYLETIDALGLESHGVVDCDWSAQAARRAVHELPADCGVTAIIGASDVIAAGAVRGALERGWRVPQDVSVTGWDDLAISGVMVPSLTSVKIDFERLGRTAVLQLLAVLEGRPQPADPDPMTEVIWRESTGPAPARISTDGAARR
jgi:DNA-binding LacI/PurR family transcriptional regulator